MRLAELSGSSRIARWGWVQRARSSDEGLLVIEFVDGSTWCYEGVSEGEVASWLSSSSRGRALEAVIALHEGRRLEGVDLEGFGG